MLGYQLCLRPQGFSPQRKRYSKATFSRRLIHSPGEGYVIHTHTHVGIVNSFRIVLTSRLDAQDQLPQVAVNIAVMKETPLMHDRRRHDSTMLHNFPIVCNDLLALPNQRKFAFMTGKLDCQCAWFNVPREHEWLTSGCDRQRQIGVTQSFVNGCHRTYWRAPKPATFIGNALSACPIAIG